MKIYLAILFLVFLIGCVATKPKPSICDPVPVSESLLCDAAARSGVRLEFVGNILVAANIEAIGKGKYTKEQALTVLNTLKDFMSMPVSYSFVNRYVMDAFKRNPGLFLIATEYIDQFTGTQIIRSKDREILVGWLDKQIQLVEGL